MTPTPPTTPATTPALPPILSPPAALLAVVGTPPALEALPEPLILVAVLCAPTLPVVVVA